MQDKALVDHYAIGIPAVGEASEVLVRGVVGQSHVRTELLEASLALRAGVIGIYMEPTAARSPGLHPVTAEPALVTRPTISWPVTHG
jgi:hypothetical protein